jgi:hypothetical protein
MRILHRRIFKGNQPKMHLFNNGSRHMYRKTFTKQDLGVHGYQSMLTEDMHSIEYQMFYKGAADKAFPAHMSTYISFLVNGYIMHMP